MDVSTPIPVLGESFHTQTPLFSIPTIAISYFAVVVIDWIILYFSIHSIRKKEVLSGHQLAIKCLYDTCKGGDLRQCPELPFDQSGRRDVAGLRPVAGTLGSDIELDQPHKQAARGISSDPTRQSLLGKDGEGGTLALPMIAWPGGTY